MRVILRGLKNKYYFFVNWKFAFLFGVAEKINHRINS